MAPAERGKEGDVRVRGARVGEVLPRSVGGWGDALPSVPGVRVGGGMEGVVGEVGVGDGVEEEASDEDDEDEVVELVDVEVASAENVN
jgi:hypothetical protein